jgi:hypothetical protein
MQHDAVFQIALSFIKRADGSYYIHSPNVPGLHLAGKDLAALRRDIDPAVRDLLRENLNIDVDEVRWVPSLDDIQKSFDEPEEGENVFLIKSRGAA